MPNATVGTTFVYGGWLIAVAAIIAFLLLLVDYFTPHGPIAHSWGTLFVLVSTALMFIAALITVSFPLSRWLLVLLQVLIILDIIGTGFCAYLLEASGLIILMLIALIGWIAHLTWDSPRLSGAEL